MRESPVESRKYRVAGHGAHRNRRLPARDQYLRPFRADYAAFEAGGGWPGVQYGDALFAAVEGANIPAAGAIQALRAQGHRLVGTAWAAASPSAHVTSEAFERIAGELVARSEGRAAARRRVSRPARRHGDRSVRRRRRRAAAPRARGGGPRVPVAASLDLHANVTRAMVASADALVAYRTYPHVDMAETGARAAAPARRACCKAAARPAGAFHPLDYLTGLPSQCSFIEPCKGLYARPAGSGARHGAMLSFTPGFPMADFAECGMAVFGYGDDPKSVAAAAAALHAAVADSEKDFAMQLHSAPAAVQRARSRGVPGARRWCLPIPRTIPAPAATATPRGFSRR